ncbi:MAG: flagellar hook protein FlgE [Treponema sp.]|nr:flagellar hook protein FlgE [Treponema sp.]
MMRSLFSGVSGLQNHQTRMDVIGNNIANVNTTGFKRNRVNFQDIFYQQLQGASRPTDVLGGINPQEVGLGMTVASIDTLHIQGALQTTNVGTDLAIQGQGFFILDDRGTELYTRAGAFSLDRDGVLVNPANGMRVQGWMAQDVDGVEFLDTSRSIENLIIPVGAKDAARATTIVNFASNLDKRTPEIPEDATNLQIREGTWSTQEKIYDSFGEAHTLQVEFSRVLGENNTWIARVSVNPESDIPTNASAGLGILPPEAGGPAIFTLNFNNQGTLLNAIDAAGNESNFGQVIMNVAYDVQSATPEDDGAMVRQTFQLNLGTIGGLTNSMTQFAERSSTRIFEQDGRTMGYMENFRIDGSGLITGIFSNGTSRPLGQIAMATFANQGGLEKAGDNNFRRTPNSGLADIGTSGIAGKGRIVAGALEMSNVDMADQFTDMIITQRGFQANSRTIQTADQLLQEVLTLKR